MVKISDESYERVTAIMEDIDEACETRDYYQDWEDVATSSYATFLDGLDTEQFDMTCAAIREFIGDMYYQNRHNYAQGIRSSFYGYLCERRAFIDFSEYDKPELPEDAEESEIERYDEAMQRFNEKAEYNAVIEKWLDVIGKIR